jgi:2',3'-cyclic-nucleotide 2'-phosphodiesterase/3'-nucleotidase
MKNRTVMSVPKVKLRLLETTDVHANILPFDYYANRADTQFGLARTATLIRQARSEAQNCLLFDNGDFLQGTPLSDLTAQPDSGWCKPHPAITAMNLLRYDAATLGNHEFNFGLRWLRRALETADFPVTCANAITQKGETPQKDQTLVPPTIILDRTVMAEDGNTHDLRIGVIGLLPPQITTWDQFHLQGKLQSRFMVEAAMAHVPRLRAQGADIVVALAHTGIDPDWHAPNMENAALPLAMVPGINAILAGHTHQVFPSTGDTPDHMDGSGVDNRAGTLHGIPTVMAGFRGSHLGVLDLDLERIDGQWQVLDHHCEARPVITPELTPVDTNITHAMAPAHAMTLKLASRPIGQTKTPLHSYLALIRNDPATQLIAHAQHAELARHLKGTDHAGLPILSASAPYKTGNRAGPLYYTDIPAGTLHLRNAADLYAFPNTLCGLRLNGFDIHDWLERAMICFNQITAGSDDQYLCNAGVPGHDFDTICGLSYDIDLAQPARYNLSGQMINPDSFRIHNLRHKGKPVSDADEFILATNSYRAFGGGPFVKWPDEKFVFCGRQLIRDIVARYIQDMGDFPHIARPVWRFTAMPGAHVIYQTGPGIRAYPDEITALGAVDLGDCDSGFACLRIAL